MQDEKHKNTLKWYKQNLLESGKIAAKKWVFRGKKQVFGVEKIRVGNQTRKVKWCKMQVLGFKIDKHQGVRR